MNPIPNPERHLRRAAFSLPEVTISMGIVAVLMLPALAMLAGGGSMQTLAQDREAASRIAREIVSTIVAKEDVGYEIPYANVEPLAVDVPGDAGDVSVHAVFDAGGTYLREISAAEFAKGVDPAGDPLHVVRITLSKAASSTPLLDLSVSVQGPAVAEEMARHKETFQSRLASP